MPPLFYYLNNTMKTIESPCIQICELENDICIGCGRTKDDITFWSSYSDEQRTMIMEKLNGYHQYVVKTAD